MKAVPFGCWINETFFELELFKSKFYDFKTDWARRFLWKSRHVYLRSSGILSAVSSWSTLPDKKKRNFLRLSISFNFCGICRRQCHYEFNTVFWNSCKVLVFCAKPKKADPINFNFCMTNKCFDGTRIYTRFKKKLHFLMLNIKINKCFFCIFDMVRPKYTIHRSNIKPILCWAYGPNFNLLSKSWNPWCVSALVRNDLTHSLSPRLQDELCPLHKNS